MQSVNRFFALAIGLLLAQVATAAEPTPSALGDLDAFIEAEMVKEKTPGLAIAVVKDGQVIYQRGFGYRDVAHKLPVTANTAFPIASVTKSFTVLSLGSLVEAGELDWDQPVRSKRRADPRMRERAFLAPFAGSYALGSDAVEVKLREDGVLIAVLSDRKFELVPIKGTRFGLTEKEGQSIEFLKGADGNIDSFIQYQPWGRSGSGTEVTARIAMGRTSIAGMSGKSDPALRAIAFAATNRHQEGNRGT